MKLLLKYIRHPATPVFLMGAVTGYFIDLIWIPLLCLAAVAIGFHWYRAKDTREDC